MMRRRFLFGTMRGEYWRSLVLTGWDVPEYFREGAPVHPTKGGDPITRTLPFAGRTPGPSARTGIGQDTWFTSQVCIVR